MRKSCSRCAYSASILNIKADIFVPENTPLQKIKNIRKFAHSDGKLHIIGENFDECLKKANIFSNENNRVFVHPFDDQDIIDGQGTIAVEIYEDLQPDIIIGCVGGGGLMSGISLYSKLVNPHCILYGAESDNCCAMNRAFENNGIVTLSNYDTFVDGACVGEVGKLTYEICKKNIEKIILISNGLLCKNMLDLYQDDGIITEPAGALSVSALSKIDKEVLRGKKVVCIISGGNNDITRYPEILGIGIKL